MRTQNRIYSKHVLPKKGKSLFAGQVTYTLTYPADQQLPTDATINIEWGDGTSTGPIPLPFTGPGPHTYTISHTFTEDGDYTTILTISNAVGAQTFTVSVSTETFLLSKTPMLYRYNNFYYLLLK